MRHQRLLVEAPAAAGLVFELVACGRALSTRIAAEGVPAPAVGADGAARRVGDEDDRLLPHRIVEHPRRHQPGDRIHLGAFAQAHGEDRLALVQGGAMRVHVPLEQLEPDPQGGPSSSSEPAVRVRAAAMSHAPSLLDLRGRRADEAREAVRQLVDDAYLAGLPEVEIVHGRGTGAVRSAVREELDRHPLVERHASESADGATRVTLASHTPT